MDPNRFVQKGGDPTLLSVRTHGFAWAVLCEGRQVFGGDLYACVRWRADADRIAARRDARQTLDTGAAKP